VVVNDIWWFENFFSKFFSLYIGGSGLCVFIIRVDNLFEKTVFTAVALRAGWALGS